MSKIYFSRSITRTMSADHPVGDPTGGAAYGEKNDPVSAVLSVATMAGTYGAVGTFGAMTLMQGLTFAGAAVSLVGNITGNKTLSKIGMIAGIAGGIGTLAENQGWISKTPTLGETFGSTANTSAIPSSTGSLKGSPVKDGSLADEMAAQKKIADANVAGGAQTKGASGQPLGYGQTSTTPVAQTNAATVTATTSLPNSGSSYTGTYTPPDMSVATMDAANVGKSNFLSDAWEGTKDLGAGFLNFAKDNPYGALAIGQIAQPVADYLSGKTDAEIDALEAQTGYADASALRMQEEIAKEKRRRENLNAGYAQVNTGINVNPAVLGQAQAGGLISGAMQPAA